MLQANLFSISGIAFDVAGAFLLVSAVVFEKGRILTAQSLTIVNGNPVLRLAVLRQRQDARFGLTSVVIGLACQTVAALGGSWSLSDWYLPGGVLAIGLLIYIVLRWRLNKSPTAALAAQMLSVNASYIVSHTGGRW